MLAEGAWAAGDNTVGLGAERLVPGVYVVRAAAGAASAVLRVTAAREPAPVRSSRATLEAAPDLNG